jgi:hypothetical protein
MTTQAKILNIKIQQAKVLNIKVQAERNWHD